MISKKDKEEILRLRQEEGLAYKAIHEKTKFSINTIMGICREAEEISSYSDVKLSERKQEQIRQLFEQGKDISDIARKVNADRKTVRLYIPTEGRQADPHECGVAIGRNADGHVDAVAIGTSAAVHFDDPIEQIRAIPETIDNLIKKEQLKEGDRAEWEKRIEDVREILRIEVDDRIAGEREEATEENDGLWREYIKDYYVEKEIAEDKELTIGGLTKTIDKKDAAIGGLTETIDKKDAAIGGLTKTINKLSLSITKLSNEKIGLNIDNADLSDYIGNYLDAAGRLERRRLEKERGDFISRETEFEQYMGKFEQYVGEREEDLSNKLREADNQKEELDERENGLNTRENGLNTRENGLNMFKNEIDTNISNANRVLSEIKWRQTFLNNALETARRLKLKAPSYFPPQSKEEDKKQSQSEDERNKMIRDAIGPETVKLVEIT